MIDHSTDRLEQLSSGQLTMLAVIALLAIAAVAGLFLDYTAPGASAVAPGSALSDFQQPGGVEPPVVLREAPGAAQEGDSMARYGYANVAGASLEADEYVSANLYGNGLGEAPTASYSNYVAWAPGTTPAPPDPLSFAGSNDNLYSMYVTTDDEMVISSGSAYVQWLQEFDISARMLIYDGDGNLLGASDVEEIAATEVEGAWQDFTFSTPIDVGPEDAVAIAIWSERPDPVADLGIFYDSLEDWEAPIEPPGPGGTSPAGPLFTGGGML